MKTLQLPRAKEGRISAIDLYNVLNDCSRTSYYIHNPLYILLIDTRSMGAYTACHIQSAFHVTAIKSGVINKKLNQFNRIVLYGLDNELGDDHHTSKAMDILEERKIDFEILDGGYEEFYSRYPFLCNRVTVWAETERESKLIAYPSVLLEDWLFQGRCDQAKSMELLSKIGITHIVNISVEHYGVEPGIEYLNVRLEDDGSSQLSDYFNEIADFIESARLDGGKVLVHCNMGISRSTAGTVAYIMKYKQTSLLDAFRCVRQRRPISSPNRGFLTQLGDYEYYLFGEQLTDAHELWLAI